MAKRPLMLDLAYGRAGTFMGVGPSSILEHVTVLFKPVNSFHTIAIPDVPIAAVKTIQTQHACIPKEGVKILFAGTGGVSPVMEEFNMMKGQVFEQIAQANSRHQQTEAKAMILQQAVQQSTDEIVKKQLDTVREANKATQSGMNPYLMNKRARHMMPQFTGEGD